MRFVHASADISFFQIELNLSTTCSGVIETSEIYHRPRDRFQRFGTSGWGTRSERYNPPSFARSIVLRKNVLMVRQALAKTKNLGRPIDDLSQSVQTHLPPAK
jgi:hypothetical protein